MSKPHTRRAEIVKLLALRERQGLTYQELSDRCGLAAATLSWWSWRLRREDSKGSAGFTELEVVEDQVASASGTGLRILSGNLVIEAVDFRKAHDGLIAIVRDHFGDDPFDGSVFVFLNRNRDRVKVLQWDRDGFWLHYKRLERGTFRLTLDGDGERAEITRPQLTMLLEGM